MFGRRRKGRVGGNAVLIRWLGWAITGEDGGEKVGPFGLRKGPYPLRSQDDPSMGNLIFNGEKALICD